MRNMTGCGIYLQDKHPLRDAIQIARDAEAAGFATVWQAESRLAREATVPMAAYLTVTERITVGAGVLNHWTRNPAALACAFSTLDDLAPGRVILGIGSWYDTVAHKVGIERSKPLKAMRENVEAVRALLADEQVTYEGEFVTLHGAELDYVHQERRPKDVPIYMGPTGPQMMALAGEIADGVLLNYLVPPEYNDVALEQLAIGADRVGRSLDDIDRPQLIACAVDEDRGRALDAARGLVTQYLAQQRHIQKMSGLPRDLIERLSAIVGWPATAERVAEAAKLVSDEVVQRLAAAGTPDEARAKVAEYVARGATSPVLYPLGDVRLTIETFADWTAA